MSVSLHKNTTEKSTREPKNDTKIQSLTPFRGGY